MTIKPKPKLVNPHPSIKITKCPPGAHGPSWKPEESDRGIMRQLATLKVSDFTLANHSPFHRRLK